MLLNQPESSRVSQFSTNQTAFVATVNGELGLVAIALRSEQGMTIQVGILSDDLLDINFTGKILQVEHEPISIMIEAVKDSVYVFTGTSDGRIAYYRVDLNEVVYVGEYMLNLPQDHESKAIESMTLVDWAELEKAALYCGLRSGLLISLEVVPNPMSQSPINILSTTFV